MKTVIEIEVLLDNKYSATVNLARNSQIHAKFKNCEKLQPDF